LTEKSLTHHLRFERRQILYLLILGVAVFLLLPHFMGFQRVLELLLVSQPVYFGLALVAEILRYFVSAASTIVLAQLFKVAVPMVPMTEAFFAGAAANRALSTGGAPGMLVRFDFLTRKGVHGGGVAVIFLIEDIIGGVIGAFVLLFGILTVTNALPKSTTMVDLSLVAGLSSPLLLLIVWLLARRRARVEKGIHAAARVINRPLEWFAGHPVLNSVNVQQAIDDFYTGLSLARHAPLTVAASFLLNVIRYLGGALGLYFSFLAMQWTIAPGVLIVIFTAVSLMSSVSAVPGEVAIMGSSMALLSLAFGVPPDVALLALLLSRAIAFWLPIPLGIGAFWHLRREHFL
jgi:glycosyltransferase 2 family protein